MTLNADNCRGFLSEELARRMRANPRYSQRAFAKQLGVSPGELSEVLRGKRVLSLRSVIKVSRALSLNPGETRALLELSQRERALKHGVEELPSASADRIEQGNTRQLSLDLFHVVSDWYCFAILNLADTRGFRPEPGWVARRLGISVAEARIAFERLERVGLLLRTSRGLVVSTEFVLSPAGVPSEAVRTYHRQILAKASLALDTQPIEEREISGVGFALDRRKLPALKKELSEFLDQIVARYGSKKAEEVYHLELALFRLTESLAGPDSGSQQILHSSRRIS